MLMLVLLVSGELHRDDWYLNSYTHIFTYCIFKLVMLVRIYTTAVCSRENTSLAICTCI